MHAPRPAPGLPRLLCAALLALSGLAWADGQGSGEGGGGGVGLAVLVSVPPLQTFVERIGGGLVQVQALVRPGQDPHSFDLKPRQVARIARADLYVRTGMEFEAPWLPRLRSANSGLRILDVRQGLELLPWDGGQGVHHGQGGDPEREAAAGKGVAGGEAVDPHVWTSPLAAVAIVGRIRDALTELDPANAATYAANYRAYTTRLRLLDSELRATLAPLMLRSFLVDHSSWRYFARDYQLRELSLTRGSAGPRPRTLQQGLAQARQTGLGVLFVHPAHNPEAGRRLAQELGVKAVALDPLAADYEENLRRFARAMMMH